jgi:hypothetical protein
MNIVTMVTYGIKVNSMLYVYAHHGEQSDKSFTPRSSKGTTLNTVIVFTLS